MAGSMLLRSSYPPSRLAGMAPSRRAPGPRAPRTASPDVAAVTHDEVVLAPRMEGFGARLRASGPEASAAHAHLVECRLDEASLTRLDLAGATLTDVAVTGLRTAEVSAPDGAWRNVEVTGGRIGTLAGLRMRWDAVTLRSVRIDYLSLPSAEMADVLIVDCTIGALDLPEARLDRVRFDGTRVEEVDTRRIRATDLDLRGLEAASFTDVRALAGAWLEPRQVEFHALAFAEALGIRVTS